MPKRPLAALCALLAFMAALVAVPLATAEPAEAHDVYYWKTVRTCIVDPPINHCTTERVRVPAHHKHLPATCPAGTTGTPPNCVADKPTTTTAAPPPTTPPKQCPAGSHRYGNGCHSHGFTPPSCGTGTWIPHAGHSITFLQPCPTTTTTAAPPPTTTTAPLPGCATDHHRHSVGGTCHGDHVPPCGVGTWDPGHGHERVDRPACAYSDASHAMGPITYCGNQSHTHKTRHSHYGGNGCHPVADVHPDPPDPTRYTGANACANWAEDVKAAINTVNPDGTYNIPAVPSGCKTSTREMLGKLRVNTVNALDAVWAELKKSLDKNYEATEANAAVYEEMAKTLDAAWNATPQPIRDVIKAGVCTALLATVMVAIVKSKGKIAKAAPFATNVYTVADAGGCTLVVVALNAVTADDDDSGTDDDSGGSQQPTPDPNDPDGDYDGDGKTTAQEATEAAIKHQAGEITDAEYTRILRRYWCGSGDPSYTSYCNE